MAYGFIKAGSVKAAGLASNAVTQAKIADDAVGADELASNAVVNASVASGAAIDLDKIDGGSAAASLTDLAQGDLLYAGDVDASNAIKSITFSNLEDAIFGNVSGDATIAAGGALTIAATSVEGSMLNNNIVSGLTDIGGALATTDELIVSDNGTIRRTDLSRLSTMMASTGLTDSSGQLSVSAAQTSITSIINSSLAKIGTHASQEYITFGTANEVNVFVNDTETLSCTASGVDITGATTMSSTLAVTGVISPTTHIDMPDSANIKLGTGDDLQLYHDGTHSYIANAVGTLKIATETSGIAVSIGHGTSEVTVNDNLTVTGDLTVNGTTTTVDTTNLQVADPLIKLNKGSTASPSNDLGIVFSRGNGSAADKANRVMLWDESADEFVFAVAAEEAGTTTGNVTLSAYSDLQVAGMKASSITLGGTAIASTAAEINILDGDTSASAVTIATADRLILNDAGTMKQVDMDALEVYFEANLDTLNSVTSASSLATVGTITSGVWNAGAVTSSGNIQGVNITATTAFVPDAQDGAALGTSSLQFSDLFLADGAVASFGDDNEITLTHVADEGLILKHVGTGDGKMPTFTLQCGDNDIAVDDKLGVINFQAPDEGAGTDAILVAAGIEAVSEGDFSASSNATKLVFKTAASEAAASKMELSSAGRLALSAEGITIPNSGQIGCAADTDLMTLANGIVTVAGEISVTTLDIGGTNVSADAAELNKLDGCNATTTELNIVDGDTSIGTTAVAGGDGIITNDAGTMRQTTVDTFDTYFAGTTKTLTNKTLTAPKFADAGFIADANGNESLIFQTTASAVNEFEMTNAATGGNIKFKASGGDSNIAMEVTPKGTGACKIGNFAFGQVQTIADSGATLSFSAGSYVAVEGDGSTPVVLPNAAAAQVGRVFFIKNNGAGTCTITAASDDRIDGTQEAGGGETTQTLESKAAVILVVGAADNWMMF